MKNKMKIVIPGGSGQVGTILARAFHRDGHEVIVLSRSLEKAPWRVVIWDAQTLGNWTKELEGADIVINLTGYSVNCRYTAKNRKIIKESRVNSTRIIGEAIAQAHRRPRLWLQASTATIYAHRYEAPNDEATGILGGTKENAPDTWRFSIDVATSWERTFNEFRTPDTRKVLLRSAMTMSPKSGGIFDTLLMLVRYGLGGTSGNGKQYVSWIHDEDFIQAIYWINEHEELTGPVNLCAPNPIRNSEFMKELRSAWGIPFGVPASEWMLEIGAVFLKTETELILKSRRVVPGKLIQSGFTFQFPIWKEAAAELCNRWRNERI